MKINFVIPGEPKGKGRHRTTKTGHTYTPKETVQYENLVKMAYTDKYGNLMLEGALKMFITAYFQIPKSASKKKRELMDVNIIFPTKKPDWDNIGKVVADSLNGIAYKDDSSIVIGAVMKRWARDGDPSWVLVEITELGIT